MRSTRSQPSFRGSRLLGWALGTVAGAALLGCLVVAGVVIWFTEVSLPNGQHRKAQAEQQMARKAAAEAQGKLATAAAADGVFTDDEIQKAVGIARWDVRRTDATWVVRAEFPSMDPVCFSYEITLPLGPATRVTSSELPTCPDIKPGR